MEESRLKPRLSELPTCKYRKYTVLEVKLLVSALPLTSFWPWVRCLTCLGLSFLISKHGPHHTCHVYPEHTHPTNVAYVPWHVLGTQMPGTQDARTGFMKITIMGKKAIIQMIPQVSAKLQWKQVCRAFTQVGLAQPESPERATWASAVGTETWVSGGGSWVKE